MEQTAPGLTKIFFSLSRRALCYRCKPATPTFLYLSCKEKTAKTTDVAANFYLKRTLRPGEGYLLESKFVLTPPSSFSEIEVVSTRRPEFLSDLLVALKKMRGWGRGYLRRGGPTTWAAITMSSSPQSFHKRELPKQLIAMSSEGGKALFREALAQKSMESFFPLSEQFVTQSEPSFCALSSLAMVLNALNHDPGKVWKGPWRWISEETLQCETRDICGHDLDKVKRNGMDFNEFESLARCHGVRIKSHRSQQTHGSSLSDPDSASAAAAAAAAALHLFRDTIKAVASSPSADSFVVVNFSRKALGQTGDGHFSPVGGYHPQRDLVLVLDVARFKYPPFWVPLGDLWASMGRVDEITGMTRGYFVVSSSLSSLTPQMQGQEQEQEQEQEGAHSHTGHSDQCSHGHKQHQHKH